MANVNLDDLQGDLFNRGFPKFHEVYYFFHIITGKEKEFCQRLKGMVEEKRISSLSKVLGDWVKIDAATEKNHATEDAAKREVVPTVNTLIAFSKSGLDKVSVQPSRFTTNTDSSRFKLA